MKFSSEVVAPASLIITIDRKRQDQPDGTIKDPRLQLPCTCRTCHVVFEKGL